MKKRRKSENRLVRSAKRRYEVRKRWKSGKEREMAWKGVVREAKAGVARFKTEDAITGVVSVKSEGVREDISKGLKISLDTACTW